MSPTRINELIDLQIGTTMESADQLEKAGNPEDARIKHGVVGALTVLKSTIKHDVERVKAMPKKTRPGKPPTPQPQPRK